MLTLRSGDVAINQKDYMKSYDKEKSKYLHDALMNYEDDIDVSSLGFYINVNDLQDSLDNSALRKTYNLMLLEYPDLIHAGKIFGVSVNTGTGLVTHLYPEYTIPQAQYQTAAEKTYSAADRIAKKAETKKSVRECIKAVDREIRKKTIYKMTRNGISAYGALVEGKAFCMGKQLLQGNAIKLNINRQNHQTVGDSFLSRKICFYHIKGRTFRKEDSAVWTEMNI